MTEETKTTKEISKKQDSQVAIPQIKRGLEEGVDSADLIIPRLMLIQNTPPKTVAIDRTTCPSGTLINSLTALPLALDEKDGVQFLPVIRGVKWVRFNALEDGKPGWDAAYEPGAKIWESRDPRDPRVIEQGAWGKNNEPPIATKFIEFLIVAAGETMPLVVGFAKTSFGAGKRLSSMVQFSKKPDIFSEKYRIRAREEQNEKKQAYYVMAVEKVGDATAEEHAEAEAIYNSFAGRELKVHGEEEEAVSVAPRQPWEL